MPALTTAFAQGLASSRPTAAAGNAGYVWLSTDIDGGTLYQSTGSSWVQLAAPVTGSGVTSVDVAAPSPLSSAGGPVTSSGTVTLAWASGQTQNRVLASPNGSSGAVSLRALVAADIPSLPASQITSGQLAAARGGTGVDSSSTTANAVFAGPASGAAAAPTFRAMAVADVVQPVAASALLAAAATCL